LNTSRERDVAAAFRGGRLARSLKGRPARIDTPSRGTLNSLHQFAGRGSGEGRENRPRSRHCDRLKGRKSGYPPLPCNAAFFARKNAVSSPIAARMGLFRWRRVRISPDRIMERKADYKRKGPVQRVSVTISGARIAAGILAVAMMLLCGTAGSRAQAQPQPQAQDPAPPQTAGPSSASAANTPSAREVTDEIGRTISLPPTVHRIVSLAPSLTETLYALGLQDLLVGDTEYCDFPPAARLKPKVGGAINPSLESIAALHPDVVLVTKSLNRLDTVRALADLGIPSYATDPHTVADILASTQRLADLLGATDSGAAVTKDMEHRLADTRQRVASLPQRRVLFVVWSEPLISIGKDTFIADALLYAGAVSIVNSSQDWPQVSLEDVAHQQPEFLIFPESHSSTAPPDLEDLATRPGWRILDAVKNHHYALISDAINRPAIRMVSAIEDLARQLHPEAFTGTAAPAETPASANGTNLPNSAALLPTEFPLESACSL
jgi:iron complex transport system substrate-binding protein